MRARLDVPTVIRRDLARDLPTMRAAKVFALFHSFIARVRSGEIFWR